MVARLLSTKLSLFSLLEALLLMVGGQPAGTLFWLQVSSPPSTLGSLPGRTSPLLAMPVPQEEILGVCVACRPPDIIVVILPLRFLVPLAEWQVCPPLGSVEATSAGSLSRLSHSASFCPSVVACQNISWNIAKQCSSHWAWPSRKSSISITCSISQTNLSSSAAQHLATGNFSLLLPYFLTISL